MTFGDPRLPPRFWAKVRVDAAGCWLWTASGNRCGYGRFQWEGKRQVVHRLTYATLVDPKLPPHPTVDLDHLCSVRNCCNPGHLEPVDHATNVARGNTGIVNRSKTHCRAGHPYNVTNTYVSPAGERACRECQRQRQRKAPYV